MRIPKKKKMFTKWAQVPNEKNVIFARGAELFILTPAWCHNELVVIAHGEKMLTLPKFGIVVIKLGATYKMAHCREKCKEIWNVCMNELYLI